MFQQFVLVSTLSSLALAGFTQINSYQANVGTCTGQPYYMYSSPYGACQIAGTPSSQCAKSDGIVYGSTKTMCTDTPLNLDGIVQLYVAKYTYTSSASCSGDPSSVEVFVGDALCHPSGQNNGKINSWTWTNCNGGKPIFKTCTDAGCTKCTSSTSSGKCDAVGAASSFLATCVSPNGGSTDDGNYEDNSAFVTGENLILAFAALLSLKLA